MRRNCIQWICNTAEQLLNFGGKDRRKTEVEFKAQTRAAGHSANWSSLINITSAARTDTKK